ncbi:ATP-dependent helicase [Helicobacter bizzozeronii]|uniref:ATP-dependent helicase n=1 Tax=Helicobacter bizzozeronii TaxID=56877 RepID=UPI000CF0E363|nr:ATP-dependent helicase [Helicobacter bizzozeronii]
MQLNLEQQQATQAPLGHNLIIASAGTGKTSTIVGRILHLLAQGINPQEILLLTFTNKASIEMKERLALHSVHAQNIQAGTFHALALRYLKQKYPDLTLKQPKELHVLLRSIAEKHSPSNQEGFYAPQHLYNLYSLYTNAQSALDFSAWLVERNPDQEDFSPYYEDILEQFCALKRTHNYMDYNDLLLLYRQDIAPTQHFAEVLCDEYQDTNPLQASILDALNAPSLFCVGDYDQSIYAFNGADISIISNFTHKYPKARVFTLTKNYRSSEAILNLANRVIAHNPRIYPKSLEVMKTSNPSIPQVFGFEELLAQYKNIARNIAQRGDYEEVAILFRNNSSADGCEASLRELGIPSRRKGSLSFFESKEVRLILDVCAFLSHGKDMVATMQILSYAPGVGSALAHEIYQALQTLGQGDSRQGLLNPQGKNPYPTSAKMGLFGEVIAQENTMRFENLRADFQQHPILAHPKLTPPSAHFLEGMFALVKGHQNTSSAQSLGYIIATAWFNNMLEGLARERCKNKDGSLDNRRFDLAKEKITRKLNLLVKLAQPYPSLKDFLQAMVLGSREAVEGSGVHLLSVHASKGLEFKEVYVIDLMEGRFPNTKLAKQGGSLEEERRLFYVATTRAKDHLYLCYAKKDRLKAKDYEPSRFLKEAGLIH